MAMGGTQLFGLAVGCGSCLISGAAFMLLQSIGWKSDGPGALCPMIVFALFGLIGLASLKAAFFDSSGPPGR